MNLGAPAAVSQPMSFPVAAIPHWQPQGCRTGREHLLQTVRGPLVCIRPTHETIGIICIIICILPFTINTLRPPLIPAALPRFLPTTPCSASALEVLCLKGTAGCRPAATQSSQLGYYLPTVPVQSQPCAWQSWALTSITLLNCTRSFFSNVAVHLYSEHTIEWAHLNFLTLRPKHDAVSKPSQSPSTTMYSSLFAFCVCFSGA